MVDNTANCCSEVLQVVPVIILANMDGTSMSVIVECIFSSSVKIILTLNEKVYQKTVIECVKKSKYLLG